MPDWSEWSKWLTDGDKHFTPYLKWWEETRAPDNEETKTGFVNFQSLERLRVREDIDAHVKDFWTFWSNVQPYAGNPHSEALNNAIEALKARVPEEVLNPQLGTSVTDMPDTEDLPTLSEDDKDCIIMGVVDIGIPLGHNRLRDADGKSRVLAAWQQLATDPSDYLPFGREILKPRIDKLLEEYSGNGLKGWLDEDAFNRATGVVDMASTFGVREAAKVAAHGAHVTDLAAGCDPHTDPVFAEKVKIIAVNTPNVDVVGNSGEFTNGFVLSAIDRIFALADAIWHKSFDPDGPHSKPCPCPIIINISLGIQAGAKNSLDLFPAYIEALREQRIHATRELMKSSFLNATNTAPDDQKRATAIAFVASAAKSYCASIGYSARKANDVQKKVACIATKAVAKAFREAKKKGRPLPTLDKQISIVWSATKKWVWPPSTVNIVMPVGNDNLTRCNALFEPGGDETVSLNWRILPDDQSPNFVELWISPEEKSPDLLKDSLDTLQVTLISPDGTPSPNNTTLQNGMTWCGRQAAVFRETYEFKAENVTTHVLRYVLCIAPTERAKLDQQTAVAGIWRIEIANKTGETVECVCSIQTDMGVMPGNAISRRSYFDDPDYTLYNSYTGMGDAREAYAYPDDPLILQAFNNEMNLDLVPSEGGNCSPVKRHGTMNATAAHKNVARVAGYRKSDGRPAFYSGTGRGSPSKKDTETGEFMPSIDDGLTIRTKTTDDTRAPTASLPTEDGIMHPGILASGGANGSVVAMRGTSFAAPQAARLIAQELLKGAYRTQSEKNRLFHRARIVEENDKPSANGETARKAFRTKQRPKHLIETLGGGRIESPISPRVPRMGDE